jgi:hypothetical protein
MPKSGRELRTNDISKDILLLLFSGGLRPRRLFNAKAFRQQTEGLWPRVRRFAALWDL